MDWNALLFVFKWIIIGLLYSVLLLLLTGVHREMASRLAHTVPPKPLPTANGRLRLLHAGSDPQASVGSVLPLKVDTILGSAPENDIVLGDRFVSRRHAHLYWDGTSWWLEDLNSKNGTYVNRQLVEPQQPQPLPPNAVISIGEMSFELLV